MQSRNRMFDDLARVTNGAASVLSGFRDEAESAVRQRVERLLADMDLVTREEFEAVREMAANARREQEALSARVTELEALVEQLSAAKRRTRKAAAGKTSTDDHNAAKGESAEGAE